MRNHKLMYNNYLFGIFAGIFLTLSYPPFSLSWLIFIGFFIILHCLLITDNKERWITLSIILLIWNTGTSYWLSYATFWGGISTIIANSLIFISTLGLIRIVLQKVSSYLVICILVPAIWTASEYVFSLWDLAWPWLNLAYAFSDWPSIVQYIAITGHLGISWWIVTGSCLMFISLRKQKTRYLIFIWGIFVLLPIGSLIHYLLIDEQTSRNNIKVGIIQPNFHSYIPSYGFNNKNEAVEHLFQLIGKVIQEDSAEIILMPENSLPYSITSTSPLLEQLKQKAKNTSLIFGAQYHIKKKNSPLDTTYHHPTYNYDRYVAALVIDSQNPIQFHFKQHLVPIVERTPYINILRQGDIFNFIDWDKIKGFSKKGHIRPISIKDTYTTIMICYESLFPSSFIRTLATPNSSVGFISIITNDGWWGESSGHEQHFAYNKLRAIELGRWIARSANNGISGFISPKGNVIYKTEYDTEETIVYPIDLLSDHTLYVLWGNWFPKLCVVISIIGVIIILWRKQ